MALLIFLFILGLLIIVHEFGHFIVAKRTGVRVENFSLGFGPRLLARKKNGTEYALSLFPLGGYVKLAGDNLEEYRGLPDEYLSKAPGERARIILCGPLLNYILGFLFFWLLFFAGYPTLTNKVGGLLDGFGAKASGIEVGDRIIAVDGKKVEFWEDLQKAIQAKKADTEVSLSLLRDGREYLITAAIKEKQVGDQLGQKRNIGLLGITPAEEIIKVRHNLSDAFLLSVHKTWELTITTYKALWRLICGKLSMRESMTGPLGIFDITSKAASLGIIALLHLVAVLSISLAIFNLLPFPVLDGGHLLFLAIEKIRGKALGLKADQIITRIGLTVIIFLALVVTYNDILRLFAGKNQNYGDNQAQSQDYKDR